MNDDTAIEHFLRKLAHETDAWDLHEALQRGEPIFVIDARSRAAYDREHIPNAVNIPHREMTRETTAAIDRSGLVVTYCDGIGCNASTKGALAMARLGFRVKELIGGLDWWKRDSYPTTQTAGGPDGCGCGP
jgi:rhodanese-related sulfurtransferase